jgi:hypothetical protein
MRRDSSRDAAAQQKHSHSLLISEKDNACDFSPTHRWGNLQISKAQELRRSAECYFLSFSISRRIRFALRARI